MKGVVNQQGIGEEMPLQCASRRWFNHCGYSFTTLHILCNLFCINIVSFTVHFILFKYKTQQIKLKLIKYENFKK